MKIGIICSAGGSACFSALDMLFETDMVSARDVLLITDRECDAIAKASKRGIQHSLVEWVDDSQFSAGAASQFISLGAKIVFLFYTRIVTRQLFGAVPTVNIHPSLLPSFAGFQALEGAHARKVRFLGATLHLVDDNIDGGEIVAQVVTPIAPDWQQAEFARVSFMQKTYLMLSQVELLRDAVLEYDIARMSVRWNANPGYSAYANPVLTTEALVNAFDRFQQLQGLEIYRR